MKEKFCDLFEEPADAICITTNGFVKNNGKLVMGAGCAGEAQSRYPDLPAEWGERVKRNGLKVFSDWVEYPLRRLIFFPVKYAWYEDADLDLIRKSATELMRIIKILDLEVVLLPRPGCGNGHLKWEDVKPVIEPILDDRVVVVHNKFEG